MQHKFTPKQLMLLAIPALAVAYSLVTFVVPAVFHAIVPSVVRNVLHLL